MIGRFASLGAYRGLFRLKDFYLALAAGGLALAAWVWDMGRPQPSLAGDLLALAAAVINGWPIVIGALKGLWRRRVNVDELVALAIVASLAQGEFLTAAVVSLVMTMGSLIEEATTEQARKAIESLVSLTPDAARLVEEGGTRLAPVEEVAPGMTIRLLAGDRVPVDAVVSKGVSALDESTLTGESIPREVGPGGEIFAGALNLSGVIDATATRVGRDTSFAKVVKLVSEAESHRPEVVRLIDRYAKWFTPAILAAAGVAWAASGEASRAVAVLIVGCPCALILAAPTATVAALGRAARAGVLLKGGRYLEEAGRATAVFFDKTGTLTAGKPRVTASTPAHGGGEKELLAFAAGAESQCGHPLALAVCGAAEERGVRALPAEGSASQVGLGASAMVAGCRVEVGSLALARDRALPPELQAASAAAQEQGATPLLVYRDGAIMGLLAVADRPRPEAAAALKGLRDLGLNRLAVLSGDLERPVAALAGALGLSEVHAGLSPADKLAIIEAARTQGHRVMYVGDGVNDGPALAAAAVGVAMGGAGTDVALQTADAVLTADDLGRLPFLVRLARRMTGIIKVNIVFGLCFNAAAVVAGGTGWLSPIAAALAHNIGSVAVVMASASLAFYKDRQMGKK